MARLESSGPVRIDADATVAAIVDAYPTTLDVLQSLGYQKMLEPGRRETIARVCTLGQAAALRGIKIDRMLAALRESAGVEMEPLVAPEEIVEGLAIPELKGDVSMLGLVPCPVRGLLVERTDNYIQHAAVARGVRVAWWLAGATAGVEDIARWAASFSRPGARSGDARRVPDILLSEGSNFFLYKSLCGGLPKSAAFGPFQGAPKPRKDLAALEDPRGILALHFAVGFTISCRSNRIPTGHMPRCWEDLADPALEGLVGVPSLELPILPDLLAAIHGQIGEDNFVQFAHNVSTAMHPTKSAPRDSLDRVPPIMILPREVARGANTSGAFEVIPDDGIIGIGAYVAKRADAPPEAQKVVDFLFSHEFLEPIWTHGMLYPNSADVPVRLARRIIARPWSGLLDGDPEAESARLLSMIHFARNE